MTKARILSSFLILASLYMVPACKTDDPPLPDNTVQFEASEAGFGADQTDTEIKLNLSRNVDAATNVTVELAPTGVTYGTHFTTTPAATNNQLTVTIPANTKTASFKVTKAANILLSGSETIDFKIKSAGTPLVLGQTTTEKLKFSQIISKGSSLKLNGGPGGVSAINSVFVDFSGNAQASAARNSWDLGFFGGSDFRVIINGTTGAAIKALTKNDLAQVTAADTTALASTLLIGQGAGTLDMIDDVDGDITKTAIKAVSATDAENVVYILNPGKAGVDQRPWYKIRVLRKGTGYTVQYARITETAFKTLDVTKDASYNFSYASLKDSKVVTVEPAKANWEITWSLATYKTAFQGTNVPYPYSDFVQINHLAGVTIAEVLTSAITYDAYAESNVATTPFKADRNLIGGNWRTSAGPNGTPAGVVTDRFYVVKDAAGNVYKLKFLNYTSTDGGERGYPNIQYTLVKKGS